MRSNFLPKRDADIAHTGQTFDRIQHARAQLGPLALRGVRKLNFKCNIGALHLNVFQHACVHQAHLQVCHLHLGKTGSNTFYRQRHKALLVLVTTRWANQKKHLSREWLQAPKSIRKLKAKGGLPYELDRPGRQGCSHWQRHRADRKELGSPSAR